MTRKMGILRLVPAIAAVAFIALAATASAQRYSAVMSERGYEEMRRLADRLDQQA